MIKQSDKFRILRRVYTKLVFGGWRQQWIDGRLQLEFNYQLVADDAERLAVQREPTDGAMNDDVEMTLRPCCNYFFRIFVGITDGKVRSVYVAYCGFSCFFPISTSVYSPSPRVENRADNHIFCRDCFT